MIERIADISTYQGDIDWGLARNELDFAIFRASVGLKNNARYLNNTSMCAIPYAAYHYVKAGTVEEAIAEADFFVEYANKAWQKPKIYFADIEYEAQTKENTEDICRAFLTRLRELGCERIGLYIGTKYDWAGKAKQLADVMWIPRWGKNDGNVPSDKYLPKHPYDIWQYTSVGRVEGISGNVDLDILRDGLKIADLLPPEPEEEKPEINGLADVIKLILKMIVKFFNFNNN